MRDEMSGMSSQLVLFDGTKLAIEIQYLKLQYFLVTYTVCVYYACQKINDIVYIFILILTKYGRHWILIRKWRSI